MLDVFSTLIPNPAIEQHYTKLQKSEKYLTILKYILVALALLAFLVSYASRVVDRYNYDIKKFSYTTSRMTEDIAYSMAFIFIILAGLVEMVQRIWMGDAKSA